MAYMKVDNRPNAFFNVVLGYHYSLFFVMFCRVVFLKIYSAT